MAEITLTGARALVGKRVAVKRRDGKEYEGVLIENEDGRFAVRGKGRPALFRIEDAETLTEL